MNQTPCARLAVLSLLSLLAVGATHVAPAAAAPQPRGDKLIANAGALQLSDFPPGWRETPSTDDTAADEAAASIADCKSYRAVRDEARTLPRVMSPDFAKGDATIDNTVVVYPTEARARRSMRRYFDPSVQRCLNALYPRLLGDAVTKDPSRAAQIADIKAEVGSQSAEPRGDEVGSYSATITVTTKAGLTIEFGAENLAVRTGRVVTSFQFQTDDPRFPLADEYSDQIDAALQRIAAATTR